MKNTIFLITLFLVVLVSLAGCGQGADNLEDVTWLLESYGEPGNLKTVVPETEITAIFVNGRLTGSGGCNTYFASYTINGSKLTLSDIGATKRACQPPIGEQENAYFQLLRGAESFQIEDGKLTIDSGNNVLIYKRE